ncbi:MAG: hypothetical protein P1Q69_00900, partial [Candidatus Thorarchaeota archaeon]|nr:hypothetical protein [Candidatus Thorarchaeota archaeon]
WEHFTLVSKIVQLTMNGNDWHRILLSDLHHQVSLKQVVFSGDKMLDAISSTLVVAELPVAKHSGKVDITVFIRREIAEQVLWTPVMVLEVKTKTAFDFNLFGLKLKRKRKKTITPAFYAWKRAMSDDEWDSLVGSGPDWDALDQFLDYENAILTEYGQVAAHDPTPPTSLWKGVIVLDTDQSPIEVYPAFQYLLEDLMTGFVQQLVLQDNALAVKPEPIDTIYDAPRVALLATPSSGPTALLDEMVNPDKLPMEDPFSDRETDERTLSLYVSIPSPTSSGVTTTKLSRNWHLLHHIQESIEASSPTIKEIVWLDLMGDYKSDNLVRKRFGLDSLLHEKRIPKKQHHQLTATLRSIKFHDLSINIGELLTEGEEAFDKLSRHITAALSEAQNSERIILLDGRADVRRCFRVINKICSAPLNNDCLTPFRGRRPILSG